LGIVIIDITWKMLKKAKTLIFMTFFANKSHWFIKI
jgi:hypothetical protein